MQNKTIINSYNNSGDERSNNKVKVDNSNKNNHEGEMIAKIELLQALQLSGNHDSIIKPDYIVSILSDFASILRRTRKVNKVKIRFARLRVFVFEFEFV